MDNTPLTAALLAAEANAKGVSTTPLAAAAAPEATLKVAVHATLVGEPRSAIPGYELLRELGRGGMGVVHLARQTALNRLVALKQTLAGEFASPEARRRFTAEAQAIARLSHPNVVQIHDIGEHEGRPYFTLEYVAGGSLADLLSRGPLAPAAAASWVASIADGLHAAHSRGILHRDLKPANVLLAVAAPEPAEAALPDEDPRAAPSSCPAVGSAIPKITDFGLVRFVDGAETQTDSILGTPSYMAPEQARGESRRLGPWTDTYALGAILYECLTGRPPFRAATALETLKLAAEQEPVRPSLLQPNLPIDLETICLKCLQKEPGRRYAAAQEVADDLRRWLRHEPIRARRISAWERCRKWVRRRRAASAAAAAIVLAALVGIAAIVLANRRLEGMNEVLRQALSREEEQRRQADEARKDMEASLSFLTDDLLAAARPEGQEGGLGVKATVRAALDAAAPRVGQAFAGRPAAEARVRTALGVTYAHLREHEPAVRELRRAQELLKQTLGGEHADTLAAASRLGNALQQAGQLREACGLFRETLLQKAHRLGEDHPDALMAKNDLASCLHALGERKEALELLEAAFPALERRLGAAHPSANAVGANLAYAYRAAGRLADARKLLDRMAAANAEVHGPRHVDTLSLRHQQAEAARAAGDCKEAIRLHQETLALREEVLGPDHADTLASLGNLAIALRQAGRQQDAVAQQRSLALRTERRQGSRHPHTLTAQHNLAAALAGVKQFDEATRLYRQTLERRREVLGPQHPETLATLSSLAVALHEAGDLAEAERLCEEAVRLRQATLGPDHPSTLISMSNWAELLRDRGRLAEAIRLHEEALRLRRAKLGDAHPDVLMSMNNLAVTLRAAGQASVAAALLTEGLKKADEKLGTDHPDALLLLANLVRAEADCGVKPEAAAHAEDLVARRTRRDGADHPNVLMARLQLAQALERAARHVEAEDACSRLLADCSRLKLEEWWTFEAQSLLGSALAGQGKLKEAEAPLLAGYKGMESRRGQMPAAGRMRLAAAAAALVRLYQETGQPEKAAKWKATLDGLHSPPAKSSMENPRRSLEPSTEPPQ